MFQGKLITTPIIMALVWSLPFGVMCDTSDVALGAVLDHQKEKLFHPVYYESKSLHTTQKNYTIIEKNS